MAGLTIKDLEKFAAEHLGYQIELVGVEIIFMSLYI